MIPHLRTLVIWIVILGVLLIAGAIVGSRTVHRWQENAAAWQARAEALAPQLDDALARGDEAIAQLGATAVLLDSSVARSLRQAGEIARLRRERDAVVIVPSVPGEAPTVGDTLAACRLELSLCAREAEIAGARGDSLERDVLTAKGEILVARDSVVHFRRSFLEAKRLLDDARPIIAAADPPCYLWKAGPLAVHCLGRKDSFAIGIAGGLFAASYLVDDRTVRRRLQAGAGVLIVGSIIVW